MVTRYRVVLSRRWEVVAVATGIVYVVVPVAAMGMWSGARVVVMVAGTVSGVVVVAMSDPGVVVLA